ncbi:hypothetical protein Tdes44962_MAKER10242 [Teratosphaeria destructans]|uniref:Uncharacterized protein n=1 Tax=Teratosphaeria destructans TaxID=418781 RepID=A0A9W7SMH9_9PEZI|nr:hypothetical protein Tdes44962_MAKER10242 [Teratosphaeria destructans]
MSFLKRLSDGIVSWVSPRKIDPPAHPAGTPPTPHTVPPFRKLQQRSNDYTFDRAIRNSRSMSPVERVDSWQMSEDDALAVGSKRKLLPTPGASDGDGGRVKRAKYEGHDDDGDVSMDDEEEELEEEVGSDEELEEVGSEQSGESEVDDDQVEGGYDDDEEGDEDSGQQYDQDDEAEEYDEDDQDGDGYEEDADEPYDANALTQDFSALKHSSSPIKEEPIDDDSEPVIDQDISNIIPEDNYEQNKPRVIDITQEHLYRGINTAKLRADGWCDDHITLVQKLAMRGFEPLMPLVFRDLLSYLPHALFARSPEEYQASYIQSGKGDRMNYALSKYLDKFMIVGGYVRSRANEDPEKLPTGKDLDTRRYSPHVRKTSEWTIINGVLEFMKYAEERDQPGLETRKKQPTCRIPILAQVAAPPGTPPAEMQERAQFKMEALYQRYEEKFRVHQSIEQSPGSTSTTSPTSALTGERLAYPIPQIYCLIATGTVVVLAAYRPDDRDMPVQTTAFFDFKEHGYDAWNVLALAIIVCHCRRVLVRIAAETGVGAFVLGTEDPVYDPDL